MNWSVALLTGLGLGFAYFGGLWLSVRTALRQRRGGWWMEVSRVGRMVLCAVVFYGLCREGIGAVLAALGGFGIARWHLLSMGGEPHGK